MKTVYSKLEAKESIKRLTEYEMVNETGYNILIISPLYYPYHLGGAEISTQLLAESLSRPGLFNIDIFTHGERHSSEDIVGGLRVMRHYFPAFSKPIFMQIKNERASLLWKIIGKIGDLLPNKSREHFYQKLFLNYDAVVLSGNGTKLGRCDIWHAARKAGVPLVQIIRDPLLLYAKGNIPSKHASIDRLYRKLSTFRLHEVPHIVGISRWILEQHEKGGIEFNNTEVIYNMVSDELCCSAMYEEKSDIILYVGNIGKHKGCHTLIKTFQDIANSIPSFRLELIGAENDVRIPDDDKIISIGHLELSEVYKKMSRAKLLILPSEWDEAFGRVLIEAVFNGTIAIGSDRGGIPEVFDYNRDFIFEAGNEKSMGEIIKKYTALDKQAYELILQQQQRLFERYRSEVNTEIWADYLMKIIRNRHER